MSKIRQGLSARAGVSLSVIFHMMLFVLLALSPSAKEFGRRGDQLGEGALEGTMNGPSIQSLRFAEVRLVDPSSFESERSVRETDAGKRRGEVLAKLVSERLAPVDDSTLFLPVEPSLTGGSRPESGQTAMSPGGGTSSAGGDPLTDEALLAQIAKCLPAEVRPQLRLTNLALEIGSEGELRVAPRVEGSLPLLSAEDRLVADQTVQAALQCGPYDKPNFRNRVFALVADFSILPSEIETSSQGIGAQAASPPRP